MFTAIFRTIFIAYSATILIKGGKVLVEAERVLKLEKKVDLILRSLDILIFHEPEELEDDELRELRNRFKDYLKGKDLEFVELRRSVGEI